MDETTVVVALVLGLLVGSAFGYFSYRAMNMNDEPVPALEPQIRAHSHLGLWLVLIATIILGVTTSRALFEHVARG